MQDDLYQEELLAEYAHPKHRGKLQGCTHQAKYGNASCGDLFEVTLQVDQSGRIKDVGWEGEGCAVSVAAMSVLSEELIGKEVSLLNTMDYQKLASMLGITNLSPGRIHCVSTGLFAVKQALGIESTR